MTLTVRNDHIARTGLPYPSYPGGRMSLGSLPNTSCGSDPCTWFDNIWVRDGCLSYLRCADPCNSLLVGYSAADAANCVGAQAADVLVGKTPAPPSLAPVNTALTPGVPTGYDWTTGQIDPSNTTGATPAPDPAAVSGAWNQVQNSIPAPPTSTVSGTLLFVGAAVIALIVLSGK